MPAPRRHLQIAGEVPPLLEAGRDAMAGGDWARAMHAFERVIEAQPSVELAAEAWAGIGMAGYWQDDPERAVEGHERALTLYQQAGRPADAARIAMWLADIQLTFFGASAVANGLIAQAERLLEGAPPAAEHAWLPIYRGHYVLMVEKDAPAALGLARDALRLAAELDVPEADVVARALEGLAMVAAGDVDSGMPRLDEASAAAVGRGLSDLNAVAWASCYLIAGCDSVRDLGRASDWCQRVMAFCRRWGLKPVFSSCRTRYASVLTWQGRWKAAEDELLGAIEDSAPTRPPMERAGLVRLGDLRRRQGDFEAAEEAFRGAGEHILALLGQAALALDRGEPDLALDLAGRALRRLPTEARTERADALLLSARAAAATGESERAEPAVAELVQSAGRIRTDALRAAGALARGVVARARGAGEEARAALEEAVQRYDAAGAPFEAAEARLELAHALFDLGRGRAAVREARLAGEAAADLGARALLERARRTLDRSDSAGGAMEAGAAEADATDTGGGGGTAPRSGVPRPPGDGRAPSPPGGDGPGEPLSLTSRELEVLALVARGLTNEEIAERLTISPHTVKRHISNMLTKSGESSRAAVVARATRAGML